MPKFHYQGHGEKGRTEGVVEAEDLDAAVDELSARGVIPIEVEPAATGGELSLDALHRWLTEPKVRLDDLVMFTRQLYSLLSAGVPLIRALRGLADNTRNPRLSREIRAVAGRLETGSTLADAMRASSDVFPPLLVAMVRVGEDSGRLEESLERMAGNLQQEKNTRDQIKKALRYPTFVMIAIVVAVGIINVFVIPAFTDFFDRFDAELPLPTRILIAVSDFTLDYWLHMAAGLLAVLLGVRYYLNTEDGRMRWDRRKLGLPLAGKIMLRALLARFARTLSMALRSGVPILSALDAVADTTDNVYVSRGILDMRGGIEQGEGLVTVASRSGLFTSLVLQMLAVGEETGQVSDMMDEVAVYYEREVEADLDALSSSIEPIVISFIGVLVLILALGIFLPMWQLGQEAL